MFSLARQYAFRLGYFFFFFKPESSESAAISSLFFQCQTYSLSTHHPIDLDIHIHTACLISKNTKIFFSSFFMITYIFHHSMTMTRNRDETFKNTLESLRLHDYNVISDIKYLDLWIWCDRQCQSNDSKLPGLPHPDGSSEWECRWLRLAAPRMLSSVYRAAYDSFPSPLILCRSPPVLPPFPDSRLQYRKYSFAEWRKSKKNEKRRKNHFLVIFFSFHSD